MRLVRPRRTALIHLRYLRALAARFKITFVLAAALFGLVPLVFRALYRGPAGDRIGFGEAFHHVYFLMFGQPSLPYVDNFVIELLNVLVPPFGIAVIADGLVRFAYLYFAKHRSDKEWIEVTAGALKNHVVICGAGRIGYRVCQQLLQMGREVVVVEKNESAAFVSVLRDAGVPVLIDDTKSPQCLPRTNVKDAEAIVCATDDDLANLNVALDARKIKPDIRVVIRLFDDDLVAKVRDTFKAEALSSSALAAPAMALSALDPRIFHSFHVGKQLLVVSEFQAAIGLPGLRIEELRERFGGLVLSLRRAGEEEKLNPHGELPIRATDVLTVQATYGDYKNLRAFTGEAKAPSFVAHPEG